VDGSYAAGFGFADIERRVASTPDTPTHGASRAKTFTAAALLRLAAEQRVDLDAPIRDILPEYPHRTTRVRHRLVHSAGLPNDEWFDPRVPKGEVRTNASHLALVTRDAPKPNFTPGSAFAQDNVAYDVAARVVVRSTGTTDADFVSEQFSRPLGLKAFVRPARFAEWLGQRAEPASGDREIRCRVAVYLRRCNSNPIAGSRFLPCG
jgi:CubicO group peptidase (beta-lactamase class C family)